jgi:hypothetical protein
VVLKDADRPTVRNQADGVVDNLVLALRDLPDVRWRISTSAAGAAPLAHLLLVQRNHCSGSVSMNHPEASRRVKALWSLLIGIIFVFEVAWILLLVYLPFALVR